VGTGCGGSGCSLTDNNTVTQAVGKLGNAAQFTAVNSESLTHEDHADLSAANIDFTTTAWVYLDNKTGTQVIVAKETSNGGYGNYEWSLYYQDTTDRFKYKVQNGVNSAAIVSADNFGSPSIQTWYLIVVWHDATANTINIQVNGGTPNSAGYSAGCFDGSNPFVVGGVTDNFVSGRIDGVGFWKRLLTSDERTALYNSGNGDDYPFTEITPTPTLISINNRMIAKPTTNSETILVKTNITSDLTIDYGLTTSYGSMATSSNLSIHEVTISDLNPSTIYHYRITATDHTDPSNSITTNDSTFKTQLAAGNTFSFGIIGDMQGHTNISTSMTNFESINPDIILTVGDNVSGVTISTVSQYVNEWQTIVFDYIQNLTDHIPFFTALGNHDAELGNYANGLTAYQQELALPTSASGGETYYSFDWGDAHFVVLNGTYSGGGSSGTIDNTQLTWLQNDLSASNQKWKFVICHFLIYGADTDSPWRLSNWSDVETVLKNNGVIAWIDGHRHVYNRYVKDGIFYVTNLQAGYGGTYWDDIYTNSGGDSGTLSETVGEQGGSMVFNVSPSRVSANVYKDSTIIESFDLTPENFDDSTPANNSYTNDTTPTFTWSASSDNASGLSKYQLYIDGSLAKDNISSSATTVDATSTLAEGAHTWYLKAVNNAGWSTQTTSTYTVNVDTTSPTVSSVSSGTPTTTGATIAWSTNENASSKIDYGLTNSYGSSTDETDTTTRVQSHSVALSGLVSCSTYHYRVRSKDAATNEKVDSDNTFTTAGCTASSAVSSQTTSQITTAAGGTLTLQDGNSHGLTLTIPTSFAGSDANFQAHQLDKTTVLGTTSNPSGYSAAGSYFYELKALTNTTTTVSTFDNALTVTIAYGTSDISGLDETTLIIYRWDGSAWNQLTGCSVSTSAKTVSCTTTHFSVFGLFGQAATTSSSSSSSSNSSSSSSSTCNDQAPGSKAPWLYGAIAQDSGSVLLYFTEADNPVSKYVLEYGTKSGNYPYGVQDMGVNSRGQMTFLVKSLSPNTTYFFKIRGGNGCAVGNWSNEISATTKGLVTTNNLDFVSSELKPVTETPPTETNISCQTHTVKSGDTLWSIAKNILGDGNKYKKIIDQNKDKYSSLETSNNLRTGWELKINCTGQQQITEEKTTTENKQGYDVKVKVTDTSNIPVEGAKVTMHSKVQEATTDKNGIALFHNVEQGDHKVLIAYDGYKGEQSLNLTGEIKEFDLNVKVQKDNLQISPLAFGIIGIMGIVIIGLIILLIRTKRKEAR